MPWTLPDPAADFARARQTVGDTPESRARWLLGLLALPTDSFLDLPLPEQRALRAKMGRFLGYEGYVSNEDAERWLKRIRGGLRKLAAGKAWSHGLVTHFNFWIPLPGQKSGRGFIRPRTPRAQIVLLAPSAGYIEPKSPHVLHHSRTLKDRMAHRICETLAAVEDRLRRCPREGADGCSSGSSGNGTVRPNVPLPTAVERTEPGTGGPCQPVQAAWRRRPNEESIQTGA